VGLLDRLGKLTQDGLDELKASRRASRKATGEGRLSALSDRELEEELLRRRRARARGRSLGIDQLRDPPEDSPKRKQLRQAYANLELDTNASLEEVRQSYKRLMLQYHPDKHGEDAERHRAATELAQSLTEAYQLLSRHLERRRH